VRAPGRSPRARRIFPPGGVVAAVARGGQRNADANEIVNGGGGELGDAVAPVASRREMVARIIAPGSPLNSSLQLAGVAA